MAEADPAPQMFVQPKFTGQRFNNHALPVDVASDLKAYQMLLVGLAKYLYRKETNKHRVPKGFDDVNLVIHGIEEGSTLPSMALVATTLSTGAMLPSEPAWMNYFEQARDLIVVDIAAETSLLERIPKDLLPQVTKLAQSLKDDEVMELQTGDQTLTAVLDHEKRERLVSAVKAVSGYETELEDMNERETELEGFIEDVDFGNGTFRICLDDKSTATVPIQKDHHEQLRRSNGLARDRIFIKCVASYDSDEHLQNVISVESLDIIRNYYMTKQFEAVGQLTEGWCNGCGIAPDKAGLESLAKKLTDSFPQSLRLPIITPTLDGNLLLEWGAIGYVGTTPCYGGGPSVNIDLLSMKVDFCDFKADGGVIEKDFDLKGDIKPFIDFLQEHVSLKANGASNDTSLPDVPSLYTVAAKRLADIKTGHSTTYSLEDVMREYGIAD
jgi:hypothetical protein